MCNFYTIKILIIILIILSGFWRSANESITVTECYNLNINCVNANITNSSNDICAEGHSGGLCESCDLYNHRSNISYTQATSFKCWDC